MKIVRNRRCMLSLLLEAKMSILSRAPLLTHLFAGMSVGCGPVLYVVLLWFMGARIRKDLGPLCMLLACLERAFDGIHSHVIEFGKARPECPNIFGQSTSKGAGDSV